MPGAGDGAREPLLDSIEEGSAGNDAAAGADKRTLDRNDSYEIRHIKEYGETHLSQRSGWLRAMVLGANDGIVSTASLILGILTAGVSGWIAGAMSMACGEYVSVSSQSDSELADLKKEQEEHRKDPQYELEELTRIYAARGLPYDLARQVAVELSKRDAVAAHMRDELGITEVSQARPLQAAVVSFISFSLGAMIPLLAILASPEWLRLYITGGIVTATLALSGGVGAYLGGARLLGAALRTVIGGVLAMLVTFGAGWLLGEDPG
eukprot:jgi/Chlat1/7341/Chrsp59S06950